MERDAQFQQSRQIKWYYHNGVATVTDRNHTMSVFLSPNCLCGCFNGPNRHKEKHKVKYYYIIILSTSFHLGHHIRIIYLLHIL